jgi:hypothetical protein
MFNNASTGDNIMVKFQYCAYAHNYDEQGEVVQQTILNADSFEQAYALMLSLWGYEKSAMQVWCDNKLITEIVAD